LNPSGVLRAVTKSTDITILRLSRILQQLGCYFVSAIA
jgi:hypothetical protein